MIRAWLCTGSYCVYEEMKTRYEINNDKNKEKIMNKRNINKIFKTDIRDVDE